MRKYKQPTCSSSTCDAPASIMAPPDPRFPEDTLPYCSRCAYVECPNGCGRMVAERLAADGYPCSTCELERIEFDMLDDRTWEEEGW